MEEGVGVEVESLDGDVEGDGEPVKGFFDERRGAAEEVMVVAKEWLRDESVDLAAEWREGTMLGPGRRWAFVRWAQVAMRRGPRVYWAWTVSAILSAHEESWG